MSTPASTLHPTLFIQDLDQLIRIKRIASAYTYQVGPESGDDGYLSYSNAWWTDPGCPLAFKYFDVDALYPEVYFESEGTGHPTDAVAADLYTFMQVIYKGVHGRPFTSVLELGTGGGEITNVFRAQGLDYIAVEGTTPGARRLLAAGHPPERVIAADLRRMQPLERTFDLVMCTEVIEHIEPFFASRVIELCTTHADTVWFSAADRNRPAHVHHMNEQDIEVWDNLFAFLGFSVSLELDNRYGRASRTYLRDATGPTAVPPADTAA